MAKRKEHTDGSGYFGLVWEARQAAQQLGEASLASYSYEPVGADNSPVMSAEEAQDILRRNYTTEYHLALIFGPCSPKVTEMFEHEVEGVAEAFQQLCAMAGVSEEFSHEEEMVA